MSTVIHAANTPHSPRTGQHHAVVSSADSGAFHRIAVMSTAARNAVALAVTVIGGIAIAGQQYLSMREKPDSAEVRAIVRDALAPLEERVAQHSSDLDTIHAVQRSIERGQRVQRYLVLHADYMEAVVLSVARREPPPPRPPELSAAAQALMVIQ